MHFQQKLLPIQKPAAMVALSAMLFGCAPPVPQDIRPVTVLVMAEQDYAQHHYDDLKSFYTGQGIVLLGDVTWPGSDDYGGVHQSDWQLFKDGTLFNEKVSDEKFRRKPADIVAHIGAESVPPGAYHAVLLVDKKPLLEKDFRILPSQEPAPLAQATLGHDCQGAPAPSVRPIHFTWPLYIVAVLHPTWKWCAVVSTILDDAGHPAGVRLDAENPKGYGYGAATASAAWEAVYPPGHGGETTVQVYTFGPSK